MSVKIRTKFTVQSITDFIGGSKQVVMHPVMNDSEENKSFSQYTPSGKLELTVTNPELLFEHGDYYIDIVKAE